VPKRCVTSPRGRAPVLRMVAGATFCTLIGCQGGLTSAYGTEHREASAPFTIRDSGRTVMVPVGSCVIVQLPTQPGTGFSWQAGKLACAAPVGDPRLLPPSRPMPGAVQEEVHTFRIASSGTCWLRLEYRRIWEHGVAPARSFELTVVAR
jgi:predicted secreted protein